MEVFHLHGSEMDLSHASQFCGTAYVYFISIQCNEGFHLFFILWIYKKF